MTTSPARRDTFSALGVGAVACAACCAGPVLAVLGGITIAGVTGTFFFGALALAVAVVAAAAFLVLRRRRQAAFAAPPEALAVDPPRRREPVG